MHTISGQIIDPVNKRQFKGTITFENGIISSVRETGEDVPKQYILPGFVDAHVHIESSMLVPSEFSRIALGHGTVATVSDPHEIANVCGVPGIDFMLENSRKVPLKFNFGVPSCVPATPFETSGAELNAAAVAKLLKRDELSYLSEMMNWPGVLNADKEVMAKIKAALELGKPVDGHAPGLMGEKAERYIAAGISTDHECFRLEEAINKLEYGMKIIIREGSAAKNFAELIPALKKYPGRIMFCSDDKHPDDLIKGQINILAARAVNLEYDLMDILEAASVTPVKHYRLDMGLLQKGDPADFIVVRDLTRMRVLETWIDGKRVFDGEKVNIPEITLPAINNFNPYTLGAENFELPGSKKKIPVIEAAEGSLVTQKTFIEPDIRDGNIQPDPSRDILKIAVVNRYKQARPALDLVRGFGLKNGAIASSVAHDSHNIVAVGTSDLYLSRAVNMIMHSRGGISAAGSGHEDILPLPVAGIISDRPGEETATAYKRLTRSAREMGSKLSAPYMLLSFMALEVIPSLKITDKGLFDVDKFEFIT
ncbi:MAG: adenine deaminase [Thermodesulfobacteriota bacterium]